MPNQTEPLTKASHSIGFAMDDLRAALNRSGPVEALVIAELIRKAARLRNDISALLGAMEMESERTSTVP